jgi:5-methylcytosine-specific restriction endonuclease McrA
MESTHARQGTWFSSDTSLLERCDLNPPHKKRILNVLVGNLLSVPFTQEQFQDFLNNCWSQRIGRSTLRSICLSVEKTRKEYGNIFNERLRQLRYRVESLKQPAKSFKGDDKLIWQADEKSRQASKLIARYLEHDADQQRYYDNPYSMAQLFTLIEKDRHGFSSSVLSTHMENAWRMKKTETTKGTFAYCSRLPADSTKPFDGVLRRLLERQAWEITQIKLKQLRQSNITNTHISIPIAIEENHFAFSLSLAELKRSSKDRKSRLQKALTREGTPWLEKNERIKDASQGTCPYTGKHIGSYGEIDHIIPRSFSISNHGTIYNSEANLIWCSQEGNQQKGNKAYHICDLSPIYLNRLYGTIDVDTITQTIQHSLADLDSNTPFDLLNNDRKRDLRHALFLPHENPARQKSERMLATQQKSRVNGTQAWLAKQIIRLLEKHTKDWRQQTANTLSFSVCRVDAGEVSAIRQQLGEYKQKFAKPDIQPVASHAIDALCVLAQAAAMPG